MRNDCVEIISDNFFIGENNVMLIKMGGFFEDNFVKRY